MKKLMLLLMLMVAMPSTAQNTDNPFPKKGYKVKWTKRTPHGFESYTCTIRKFEDSDTIYYMTYSPPDLQPYCVCFSLIHQKGAEMIKLHFSIKFSAAKLHFSIETTKQIAIKVRK